MVWTMYRGRADCENRIKEIKEDFGFDNFNIQDFAATEAALNFVVVAYPIGIPLGQPNESFQTSSFAFRQIASTQNTPL